MTRSTLFKATQKFVQAQSNYNLVFGRAMQLFLRKSIERLQLTCRHDWVMPKVVVDMSTINLWT